MGVGSPDHALEELGQGGDFRTGRGGELSRPASHPTVQSYPKRLTGSGRQLGNLSSIAAGVQEERFEERSIDVVDSGTVDECGLGVDHGRHEVATAGQLGFGCLEEGDVVNGDDHVGKVAGTEP